MAATSIQQRTGSIFTRLGIVLFLVVGLLGSLPVSPVHAASTITVTNTNDSGAGSLRDAVSRAMDGDTIVFDPSLTGKTIGFKSTITVQRNITIDGGSLSTMITLDGDPENDGTKLQLFYFNWSATAQIDYVHITKSYGIQNWGILTASHLYFENNSLCISNNKSSNVDSTLTVVYTTFENNATGFATLVNVSGANAQISRSVFSSNTATDALASSGGVDNWGGTLTVRDTTFNGNGFGGSGGAINNENGGTLTVSNSTFVNNYARLIGGAIQNDGNSTLTVYNSSFSKNTTRMGVGAAIYNMGVANLINNTFSANGASTPVDSPDFSGSVASGDRGYGYQPVLHMTNNILANSIYANDCTLVGGSIGTNVNNLIESNDGCGAVALTSDPMLAPLASNGGYTQTFLLVSGSPAINAGNDAACQDAATVNRLDQREVSRPQGSHCDLGAVEMPMPTAAIQAASNITASGATLNGIANVSGLGTPIVFDYGPTPSYGSTAAAAQSPISAATDTPVSAALSGLLPNTQYYYRLTATNDVGTVTTGQSSFTTLCGPAIVVTNTTASGQGSLPKALVDVCDGGSITFAAALSGQTLPLSATMTVNKNLTIDGSALASPLTLSGGSLLPILTISTSKTVALTGLKLADGNAGTGNGGAINNSGNLTLTRMVLTGNSASGAASKGAGIYNASGATLVVIESTLADNTASGASAQGGAIYNAGTLSVVRSTFIANGSAGGGAIYSTSGSISIGNSTFSANVSTGNGGAIYNASGQLTLKNATVSGNTAGSGFHGGGVYNSGRLTYTNNILANPARGEDCYNNNILNTNTNNLVMSGNCGTPLSSADPLLEPLANNNGITQTFALQPGSPAIDAGSDSACSANPVSGVDQRGVPRPQGTHCDLGAFESGATIPSVTIAQAAGQADPTSALPIQFTVTFSEKITASSFTDSDVIQTGSAAGLSWTVTDSGDHRIFTLAGTPSGPGSVIPFLPAGSVQSTAFIGNADSTSADNQVNYCLNTSTVTSTADAGTGSLRQAQVDTCVGGTIQFALSLNDQTIFLSSPIILDKNVSIIAGEQVRIVLSGNHQSRVIEVKPGVTANLTLLELVDGQVERGGAILNSGTLSVSRSTIASSSATGDGGGIYNEGTLSMVNSTLGLNSALGRGGGIYNNAGLSLNFVTLSGNSAVEGGALFNQGALDMSSTILANSPSGGDCANPGTLGTNASNLVEDGSCSPAVQADPLLSPLGLWTYSSIASFGRTRTFALLPGSPAIDAGVTPPGQGFCSPMNDQRGVMRPGNADFYQPVHRCDIGAFESPGLFLRIESGDQQFVEVGTPAQPLKAFVWPQNGSDPVLGGTITYTAPGTGASLTTPIVSTGFTSGPNNGGFAAITPTANATTGPYQVSVTSNGLSTPNLSHKQT